ncbi:MAG: prepilin-type N-terminal cleavage/methylation domain-containing protein [Betaproteobacteria bacterium]|nr:prepilin-type N-terminal cleavage/methylation domain-containing protein [Betaproteobacteria bacterium]
MRPEPARPRPAGDCGFTLVELAIVLFIVTLLLGGMLMPLGRQIAERQAADTRRALEHARTALVGYALARRAADSPGHLPCPDLRAPAATGRANDGTEDRLPDGRCAASAGNLPWRSLGLAEGDAWGNRLGYAVTRTWSRPGAHAGGTAETLEICRDAACAEALPAAAVLISHGGNGFGAGNAHGGVNLAPSGREELANARGGERYYMLAPREAGHGQGEFDDLLLPLSADWLRGRLCDPAALCAAVP